MEFKALSKQSSSMEKIRNSDLWKRIVAYRFIYLLLLPGITFFIIFAYAPMYGIILAFKDYSSGLGIIGSPWVGLDKFKILWSNPEFWAAFKNTITIAFLKISIGFPIPIIIAVVLNEIKSSRLKRVLQTIYTFPHFLSWVVVAGIITNLLSDGGAVNNLLQVLGKEHIGFLTQPYVFRALLIFSDIWKEAGWSSIMFLAAIASIDPALYESSTIDGANRWHKTIYVTWPGILGLASVLLILAIGNVMNAGFDQIFNLYNPPVFKTADIIDTYIYRQSFQMGSDFGYTTAVGLFKGVINCVLLLSANTIIKRSGQSSVL